MTGQELAIGSIGISVILTILLRMIYGTWNIPNRFKPWIAVGLGMALAVVVLFASGEVCTFARTVTYLVQGFLVGATSVGLYEMTKRRD